MTLILNVLRTDMSILAADRRAIAEWPASTVSGFRVPSGDRAVRNDFNKITLNSVGSVALGIAGKTQDHSYLREIEMSAGIDEALIIVRKHMERFLLVHDRASLSMANLFTANQGIASFFDEATGMYFSNTYLFTPVRNETRLHRAAAQTKVLSAGTGSESFDDAVGYKDIESIFDSTDSTNVSEACILWIKDAFRRVSAIDEGTGPEPAILVSTRAAPGFRVIESDC